MIPAALDPRRWLPEAQRGRSAVRFVPVSTPRPPVPTTPAAPPTATATAALTPRPESPAVARPAAATTTATAPRLPTVREKLLVAATSLDGDTFHVADLVVRAWQLYPETFALEGHPEHPDSNRVQAKLCGADGLCGRGWLVHVAASTYRVTRRGHLAAREVSRG